jgi:hypothetical protein
MLTTQQLKAYIEQFIQFQVILMNAFKESFPLIKDWINLLDFPRYGDIKTPSGNWKFQLHGSGLNFVGPRGTIIDVHDMVSNFEIIDAWRILQFLESMDVIEEDELEISEVEAALNQLTVDGVLIAVEGNKGKYHLSR